MTTQKLSKEMIATAKFIAHVEDAAKIIENGSCSFIAATRDGLRAFGPRFTDATACVARTIEHINLLLAAKHLAQKTTRQDDGPLMKTRFEASRPDSDPALVSDLRAFANLLRETSGIGERKINRSWGQPLELK